MTREEWIADALRHAPALTPHQMAVMYRALDTAPPDTPEGTLRQAIADAEAVLEARGRLIADAYREQFAEAVLAEYSALQETER